MNKLSAVLIVKNEKANIGKCLDSLGFADEIIVLDTGSTDDTAEIAASKKAKVFYLDKWHGFGKAKGLAVSLATNDWIFSIDADEIVSLELADRIKSVLAEPKFDLYRIKRKSFYLGKMINHSGWQNDYPKRLFNRTVANFNEKEVHESVVGDCPIGSIEEPIYHYTYPTISSHLQKIDLYTEIAANSAKSRNVSFFRIFGGAFLKFIKMYFFNLGILDGREGLILSWLSSVGVAVKYLKIKSKSH